MADGITPDSVWDAEQLQRALHRAVLAVAAVQRDEPSAKPSASAPPGPECAGSTALASTPTLSAPTRRCPTSATPRARPGAAHQHRDLAQRGHSFGSPPPAALIPAPRGAPIDPAPSAIDHVAVAQVRASASGSSPFDVDERRIDLDRPRAARAPAPTVGGHDRHLASGRVHLGQQHRVSPCHDLDVSSKHVARAGVAVQLEGQPSRRRQDSAPRATRFVAAIDRDGGRSRRPA